MFVIDTSPEGLELWKAIRQIGKSWIIIIQGPGNTVFD
jgi:hypothetical protein